MSKKKEKIIEKKVSLQKQSEGTRNYLEQLKEQKEFSSIMEYDFEVDSYTLLSLIEGWDVKVKHKDIFETLKNKKHFLYSFVGQFNVGKTYWANILSNFNLKTGHSTETRPLCLKLSEGGEHQLIGVLDTAGKGRAIRQYSLDEDQKLNIKTNEDYNKLFQAIREDKEAVDNFNEDFIIFAADAVVIVVGHLKKEEQVYISKVMNHVKKLKSIRKIQPKIVVLHNFDKALTDDIIQNRINDDIKGCFNVEEFAFPEQVVEGLSGDYFKYYFKEVFDDTDKPEVYHLVVGDNNVQQIQKKYNEVAIKYLKSFSNDSKQRDFMRMYVDFFNSQISNYIEVIDQKEKPEPQIVWAEGESKLKMQFKFKERKQPRDIKLEECINYIKVRPLTFNRAYTITVLLQIQYLFSLSLYIRSKNKNEQQ